MLQAERVADYLQSKLPQASEVTAENVFRIPGGPSRETWPFDARWREDGAILKQLVTGPQTPTGLPRLADNVGCN